MVKVSSLLLHGRIWLLNYWAVTGWFEFNLTLEEKVLGVQPFLREVYYFLMDLFLLLLGLGFLVL